mgnify:CR=1 FL=1
MNFDNDQFRIVFYEYNNQDIIYVITTISKTEDFTVYIDTVGKTFVNQV